MANTYFQKFTNDGIEFMDGRTAGDINDLIDKEIYITDFGFIKDRKAELGKYAVFMIKGDDERFYFASSVLSDNLNTIEEDGMRGALEQQKVILRKRQSKATKRDYIYPEFV